MWGGNKGIEAPKSMSTDLTATAYSAGTVHIILLPVPVPLPPSTLHTIAYDFIPPAYLSIPLLVIALLSCINSCLLLGGTWRYRVCGGVSPQLWVRVWKVDTIGYLNIPRVDESNSMKRARASVHDFRTNSASEIVDTCRHATHAVVNSNPDSSATLKAYYNINDGQYE